jgi:hypothetical protein
MLGDEGLHLGQLNQLVDVDRLGWRMRHQRSPTAGAFAGMVLDHLVRSVADDPAVTLVARTGTARLGLLPLLFTIRGGWLGGCARCLLWPL